MSIKEKVNFLTSLNMKDLFNAIIEQGDAEDLINFIKFNKDNMNELLIIKNKYGKVIPLNFSPIFGNLLNRKEEEKINVLIDLFCSRDSEALFGFDNTELRYSYGEEHWYDKEFIKKMLGNDCLAVRKKVENLGCGIPNNMAGFAFENASKTMFEELVKNGHFTLISQPRKSDGLTDVLRILCDKKDNKHEKRFQKIWNKNDSFFKSSVILNLTKQPKIENPKDIQNIKYVTDMFNLEKEKFDNRGKKMNIAELLIRNDRMAHLKMFIDEHIIEWDYTDFDGRTLDHILEENKFYEDYYDAATAYYFRKIRDIVNINKEQKNLNELLNTTVSKASPLKRI